MLYACDWCGGVAVLREKFKPTPVIDRDQVAPSCRDQPSSSLVRRQALRNHIASRSPQSNSGRARRSRTTTQQSPHDAPHLSPNCPSLQRSPPPSNIPIPRPTTPLTTPTASGCNQPFCHNTLSGPTDRPTDKRKDRQIG